MYIYDKDVEFPVLIHMSKLDVMVHVESVQYSKQTPRGCLLAVEQPQYVCHC